MTVGRLVFDSSPLNYFARSNQLPVLGKLVSGDTCFITRAVEDELLRGGSKAAPVYQAPAQAWLTVVDDSSIDFLKLSSEYHRGRYAETPVQDGCAARDLNPEPAPKVKIVEPPRAH